MGPAVFLGAILFGDLILSNCPFYSCGVALLQGSLMISTSLAEYRALSLLSIAFPSFTRIAPVITVPLLAIEAPGHIAKFTAYFTGLAINATGLTFSYKAQKEYESCVKKAVIFPLAYKTFQPLAEIGGLTKTNPLLISWFSEATVSRIQKKTIYISSALTIYVLNFNFKDLKIFFASFTWQTNALVSRAATQIWCDHKADEYAFSDGYLRGGVCTLLGDIVKQGIIYIGSMITDKENEFSAVELACIVPTKVMCKLLHQSAEKHVGEYLAGDSTLKGSEHFALLAFPRSYCSLQAENLCKALFAIKQIAENEEGIVSEVYDDQNLTEIHQPTCEAYALMVVPQPVDKNNMEIGMHFPPIDMLLQSEAFLIILAQLHGTHTWKCMPLEFFIM